MLISEFKKQFNQNSPYIHFNNSGMGPVPEVYRNKTREWFDRFYSEAAFCALEGWEQVEVTRKTLAEFIGADTEEVSFLQTTASALSQAAFSIPLKEGDEILTWDQEYPSNFYPWRMAAEKAKAKLIQVPSVDYATPYQALLERVTDKTKVVAISWVQFLAGATTDLKALSSALKGRDIWLVADIIQGAGVKPFHFHDSGFDIVCSGCQKWMCSGLGAAFMAVKKEKLLQMEPLEYGAMTFGTPDTPKSFSLKVKTTGHRFEPGSKSMVEIIAMNETLKLFSSAGINNIYAESCRLTSKLRAGLRELNLRILHPDEGPIVNVTSDSEENVSRIADALTESKISFAKRGPGIRLSLHAFNLDSEVEKALTSIERVIKK
jgi:selenocysteine lyase/cysteine desulfurase